MPDDLLLNWQQLPLNPVLQKHFPLCRVPWMAQKLCLHGRVLRNPVILHGVPPHCSLAIVCLLLV